MLYLTLGHLLQLHALAVKKGGGSVGVRDVGRLDAALATQTQEVFGQELYVTVYDKAAAMIRGIIGDHPFADGNKRTAMLVGLTFLEVNSVTFAADEGELEDFAVTVATERLDVEAIAAWLEQQSKKENI